jgi:hypothetical protein
LTFIRVDSMVSCLRAGLWFYVGLHGGVICWAVVSEGYGLRLVGGEGGWCGDLVRVGGVGGFGLEGGWDVTAGELDAGVAGG